tara:strand:- start:17503 stop:18288 length:786 start_codon:yes stop_codon:yes gene_type:complete
MKEYFKKSLGQNFLIDKNIIKKIVDLVNINKKNVIEIGPGNGALTDEIIKKKPKKLILFEKDYKLVEKLKLKYSYNKSIKIYQSDILKIEIEEKINKNTVIFGNLPYNISSQILVKFLKFKKWPPKFNDIIFMFQKELGEKIICKYPSKNYGRISILTNYRLNILDKFYISPNCFFPKPKVNSMIIHFNPKKKILKKININNLEKITNVIFSNKRKMINKNIKKIISPQKIKSIPNLSVKLRPAEIRPEIYYKITELFEKG